MLIGEWRCSSSSTTADDSDTHTVTVSKCLVCHTWTHCSIVHRQGGSDAAAVLVILNRKQLIVSRRRRVVRWVDFEFYVFYHFSFI